MHVQLDFPEISNETFSIECFVENGKQYHMLKKNGLIIMKNTPDIVIDFIPFLSLAEGHVLINGLGMGMCNEYLLTKPTLRSLTVIEYDKELIDFLLPILSTDSRCEVIHADALEYIPEKTKNYDYVWHDIWTTQSRNNVLEINKLKEKYSYIAKWQGAWREEQCIRQQEAYISSYY